MLVSYDDEKQMPPQTTAAIDKITTELLKSPNPYIRRSYILATEELILALRSKVRGSMILMRILTY